MPKTRRYKQFEKNLVHSIAGFFKTIFMAVGRFFTFIFRCLGHKLTVMIVPHSQKKPINFQATVFSLILSIVIVIGIISSFFLYNTKSVTASAEIARLKSENKDTRASLDQLRDETNNLLRVAQKFQTSLSQTLSSLGIQEAVSNEKASIQNGDLSSLFAVREMTQGSVKEVAAIQQLSAYLENASQPMEEIGELLESQTMLFSDIPSLWPMKGGIGHISGPFGSDMHPITGDWYIHKGLDISTYRSGDPVITTANGQVVTVDYDASFGNYIIIKHKYGFYTRYAHLNSTRVKRGQYVSQGQIIGTNGNTGLSTGPHLHYEVHIGSDVVDPAKYITVKALK